MEKDGYITSLIVRVNPLAMSGATKQIAADDEVDIVHSEQSTGKLIVIIESDSLAAIQQHIDRIHAIDGVLSASMVYQHSEPASALDEVLA